MRCGEEHEWSLHPFIRKRNLSRKRKVICEGESLSHDSEILLIILLLLLDVVNLRKRIIAV